VRKLDVADHQLSGFLGHTMLLQHNYSTQWGLQNVTTIQLSGAIDNVTTIQLSGTIENITIIQLSGAIENITTIQLRGSFKTSQIFNSGGSSIHHV
jgi:hypothetical protein